MGNETRYLIYDFSGQFHTRLAILERRHQVTRRAISLFLESNPSVAAEKEALIIALTYIVPQLNRIPNVHGYSPIQWGWATRHMCPACCLTNLPSAIQHTWPLREVHGEAALAKKANKAIIEADTNFRLRRALLGKYMGQPLVFQPGDLCYYWRDTPAGSTAKLK